MQAGAMQSVGPRKKDEEILRGGREGMGAGKRTTTTLNTTTLNTCKHTCIFLPSTHSLTLSNTLPTTKTSHTSHTTHTTRTTMSKFSIMRSLLDTCTPTVTSCITMVPSTQLNTCARSAEEGGSWQVSGRGKWRCNGEILRCDGTETGLGRGGGVSPRMTLVRETDLGGERGRRADTQTETEMQTTHGPET